MKISTATQFHTQAGGTAQAGGVHTNGQQQATKPSASGTVGTRDSFERHLSPGALDQLMGPNSRPAFRLPGQGVDLPPGGLTKQMDGTGSEEEPPGLRDLDVKIAALERIREEIVRTGHSGRLGPDSLARIDDLLAQLEARRESERRALVDLSLESSQMEVIRGDGRGHYQSSFGDAPGPRHRRRERPEQSPVVEGSNSSGGGATHTGPTPGPGGTSGGDRTLTGRGDRGQGGERRSESGTSRGGRSQKADNRSTDYSQWGGGGNAGEGGVVGGRSDTRPASTSDSSDNGDTAETTGGGDGTSGGTTCEQSSRETDPLDWINTGVERQTCQDDDTGLPPADPEGGGSGGNDIGGGGKLEKYKVKGVTEQEKDLVGPAFGRTTGPDDKERPNTGATSGSVSGDPTESRSNDVGGRGMPGRTGGGSIDVSVGEVLLKTLGIWEKRQPGGPDPAK